MNRSLAFRLTLAFALVAFTSAAVVAVIINLTGPERLNNLIVDQQRSSLEQILVDYYSANGSWDKIAENWQAITFRTFPTPAASTSQPFPQDNQGYPGPGTGQGSAPDWQALRDRRSLFALADTNGVLLVELDHDHPAGYQLPAQMIKDGTPVQHNGQTIGYLVSSQRTPGWNPAEALFIKRTNQALILGMLGALLVALVISIILTRTLTRPLRALTSAAQNIAKGQLEQQVNVKSEDEIGQLAHAFNRMSQEVASSNQQRRQMTADIAHDLRTPLTVIGGYVESMRDGVLQPTPQRLSLIYTEIERLQRLVGDLRMLSQADAGELPLNPQVMPPQQIIYHAAELFQHHADQNGVALNVETGLALPPIFVDEARMMQVMDNLISNALRYTPSGGSIWLGGSSANSQVTLTVKDTGSGIPAEELPLIFNRFHRADKSRHSENGESGLGLAIVRALVEAHHGRVWAESSEGQGTCVFIELPIHDKEET